MINPMVVIQSKYQIWELSGNYPIFTVEMIIYHYVEKIWIVLVTPIFLIKYMVTTKCYPGELVNIHIQELINIT